MICRMEEKVRKFLWYAFIFILPFQTVWILRDVYIEGEKWEYASVLFYASDLFLLGFFLLSVLNVRFRKKITPLRDRIFLGIFGLIVLSTLSFFWALDPVLALFFSWKSFLALLVYMSVRYGEISYDTSLKLFSLGMLFHSVLGISQWIQQYSPEISILGVSQYEAWRPGVSVLKTEMGRWLRVYGGMPHPNILGGISAVVFLALIFLVTFSEKKHKMLWIFFVFPFFLWGVLFSFSRTAWLGLFLGWGVVTLGVVVWKQYRMFAKRWMYSSLLSLCVLLSFVFSARELFFDRISEESIFHKESFFERDDLLDQSRDIIHKHPFFGVGAANFTLWTRNNVVTDREYVAQFQPVHNIFFLLWSELGLVGIFVFLWLLLELFIRAFKDRNLIFLGILSSMIPYMVLDHWLWTSHVGMLFFVFILSVSWYQYQRRFL